jgi:hypothetical protein
MSLTKYQDPEPDPYQDVTVLFVFLPKYPLLTALDEKLTGPTAFSRIAEGAGSCRRFRSKNFKFTFFYCYAKIDFGTVYIVKITIF